MNQCRCWCPELHHALVSYQEMDKIQISRQRGQADTCLWSFLSFLLGSVGKCWKQKPPFWDIFENGHTHHTSLMLWLSEATHGFIAQQSGVNIYSCVARGWGYWGSDVMMPQNTMMWCHFLVGWLLWTKLGTVASLLREATTPSHCALFFWALARTRCSDLILSVPV